MTTVNVVLLCAYALLHVYVVNRTGRRDLFSPISFLALLNLVRVTPYALSAILDPSVVDGRVLSAIGQRNFQAVVCEYLIIEVLSSAVFFYILSRRTLSWSSIKISGREHLFSHGLIWCLLAVGLVMVGARASSAGGLSYLLENLARRTELTAGRAYLFAPGYIAFAAGIAASAQRYAAFKKRADLALMILVLLCGFAGMSVFGGRKDGLLLLCTALISYSYYVRPFKWTSLLLPVLVLGVAAYNYVVHVARQVNGLALVLADPGEVLVAGLEDIAFFFKTLSYMDTYLFIIHYFQEEPYWGLAILRGVSTAFIPSLIYPEKPPVDEGVYVRALLEGEHLVPPVPARDLYLSSLPPETLGNGYLAYGVIGVLVFMALKAYVLRSALNVRMIRTPALATAFLVYFVFNFQISPLRFVQVTMLFALCLAISFLPLAGSRRTKKGRITQQREIPAGGGPPNRVGVIGDPPRP